MTLQLEQTQRQSGAIAAWLAAFAAASPDAAIRKARGDFAIVVHDAASTTFAVDRFAIRTLCYRIDGDTIRVAQRADDLADDSTEIDPQAIFDYLYFHAIPSPRTIFKGMLPTAAGPLRAVRARQAHGRRLTGGRSSSMGRRVVRRAARASSAQLLRDGGGTPARRRHDRRAS